MPELPVTLVIGHDDADEAIWKIIQDACDEALRAQRFGAAAVAVTTALDHHGWKIVRA